MDTDLLAVLLGMIAAMTAGLYMTVSKNRRLRPAGIFILAVLFGVLGYGAFRTHGQLDEKGRLPESFYWLHELEIAQNDYLKRNHVFYAGPVAPFVGNIRPMRRYSPGDITANGAKSWTITVTAQPPCSRLYGCYSIIATGPGPTYTSTSKQLNDEMMP